MGTNYNAVNIEKCIAQFIFQVNYMNSIFKYANCEVKMKMFNTYCMPCYGCVLWYFNSNDFSGICS